MGRHAREAILGLDKELKAIQPFLFSFEDEPEVTVRNTKLIRLLPKRLGDELLLVCVNRATEPVEAEIDLSSALSSDAAAASVLFERRGVRIGKEHILKDKFPPLGRHVYKIGVKKQK